MRDVAVATDRPPGDDGETPVARQVELLDHHLAADVRGRHGAAVGHGRQGSATARLAAWANHSTWRAARGRAGGARGAGGRATGRRPRIDADQPRPAVPAEPRGRDACRGRRPRRRGDAGHRRRSTTGGSSSVWTRAALETLATAAARLGAEGRPTEPRGGACGRWLGGDDRVRDDDRGPRRRDPGLRDGRDRRRPSRAPVGGLVRHLVGSRGARANADGRRLRRAEVDPRRPGDARVPRDARRAGRGDRAGRVPGFFARSAGVAGARLRCPTSRRRRTLADASTSASGSAAGSWSASRCPPRMPCPTTSPATPSNGPWPTRTRGDRGPGADTLAARPDRNADRRRVDPRQHVAHRQQRAGSPGELAARLASDLTRVDAAASSAIGALVHSRNRTTA